LIGVLFQWNLCHCNEKKFDCRWFALKISKNEKGGGYKNSQLPLLCAHTMGAGHDKSGLLKILDHNEN
jgi:hypothetical protein